MFPSQALVFRAVQGLGTKALEAHGLHQLEWPCKQLLLGRAWKHDKLRGIQNNSRKAFGSAPAASQQGNTQPGQPGQHAEEPQASMQGEKPTL
jgi:hypothetical protein